MEGGERTGLPATRGQQSQVGRSSATFGRASSAENQWQQQPKSSTLSYPGEVRKSSLLQKTIGNSGQSVNKKDHDKLDRFTESKVEYFCIQTLKWTDQAKLSVNKTRWPHVQKKLFIFCDLRRLKTSRLFDRL
jgi:hypothetical protein